MLRPRIFARFAVVNITKQTNVSDRITTLNTLARHVKQTEMHQLYVRNIHINQQVLDEAAHQRNSEPE